MPNIISGTFTRPADTNAYAALDGVTDSTSEPAAITFAGAIPAPGVIGIIRTAILRKSTNVTANAQFRLWLFDGTPATIPNDNAAYAVPLADAANLIGYVDFNAPVAGSDCAVAVGTLNPDVQPFTVQAGRTVKGILQALAAYSPGSEEVITIELGIL